MRKFHGYALSLLFALAPLVATAKEGVFGVWMRGGHTEKMEFFDCDGKLCAHGIIPSPDGSPPPMILRHAAKTGPNQWKGDLFNPENAKTYTGTVTLDEPDKMTLTGCLMSFLCQSEPWTRVAAPTPAPAAAQQKPALKIAPAKK